MRMTGTNSLRCLLALGLMSGLVACGGEYSESDVSSLPQLTATSAEGRWTGTTSTGRAVARLILEDGSYWLFYSAIDNPHILAGLVQGTGTSHGGSFRLLPFLEHQGFQPGRRWHSRSDDEWQLYPEQELSRDDLVPH